LRGLQMHQLTVYTFVEVNEDRLILSAAKNSLCSADFSNVQIVHKFAG